MKNRTAAGLGRGSVPHLLRVVSLMLLVLLAGGYAFAQATHTKDAWPAYMLSIFLGFGSGRYYLGQNGTLLLLGDLIGAGVIIAGVFRSMESIVLFDPSGSSDGISLALAGCVVIAVSRLFQIIDVVGAVDRARAAGEVGEVVPVFDVQPASFVMGVAFRY